MNKANLALLEQLLSPTNLDVWSPYEHKFIGPDSRNLAMFTEVNSESALLLISQIKHLAEISPEEPITILLNTEGGSLTDALAIYDCITQVTCPVLVLTTGLCASAGLIILSAADYRVATPNTTFFYHQPVCDPSSLTSSEQLESLTNHYLFCKNISDKLIKKRSGIKANTWNKNFKNKTSFYFTTKQAKDFNLIDAVTDTNKVEFELEEED